MFNLYNKKKLSPQEKFLLEARQREADRRKKFLKDQVLPFFREHVKSVHDARVFCTSLIQAFEQGFKNLKVADLKLEDEMKKTEEAARYKAILNLLGNETVDTALGICNALDQSIEASLIKESETLPLGELDL